MVTDSPGVVFGEHSTSKAAATFASDIAAHAAADQLRGALGLGLAQVQVITPNDRNAGRKLQPDDKGIERTLIRTHAVMGVAGLLLGLAVFGLLWALVDRDRQFLHDRLAGTCIVLLPAPPKP